MTGVKVLASGAVGTTIMSAVSLSGGELASITVAALGAMGVGFAALMSNRASKYEADLEREESQLTSLRAEVKELRARIHAERVQEFELRDQVLAYKHGTRILTAQLAEYDIAPEWDESVVDS